MPFSPPHTLILGAGVTGLALALRLGERGGRATLLEADARPGGLAKSLHFKGLSTDMGPHRIHTEIPEVAALIDRVAAPSLMVVQRQSHIYLRGQFLKYPPSPFEMARRLGPLTMARFGASYALEQLRRGGEEETYESLMRGAFGKALYDYLLRPYSAKTWKIDPAELHADTARVRVSAGSLAKMLGGLMGKRPAGANTGGGQTALKQFKYVRGGAETLVRHLWEHAEQHRARLKLSTAARWIELEPDPAGGLRVSGVRVQSTLTDAASGPSPVLETADAYASTLPLPQLFRMLPEVAPLRAARDASRGLAYLDMVFVCVIVNRKVITGDNWLYFPEPHLIFNRAYEAKNFDPGMAPEDQSVLCVEITHRPGEAPGTLTDAELRSTVVAQLESTGLFQASEVDDVVIYRVPWAYPLYALDYADRLEKIFSGLRGISNFITLGRQGLFNHNNMDHSIWMGLRAGDLLGTHPTSDAVQQWYQGAGDFKTIRIVD